MAADCCDAESFGVKAVPLDGKLNIVFDFWLEKLKGGFVPTKHLQLCRKTFPIYFRYSSSLTFEVCSILEQAADILATFSIY